MTANTLYKASIGAVVILLLVHGVTVQAARRDKAQDKRTSQAITQLANSVDEMYQADFEVPESLNDVVLDEADREKIQKAELEYEKASSTSYEICANFNQKSDGFSFEYQDFLFGSPESFNDLSYTTFGAEVDPYMHDSGRECFSYSAVERPNFDQHYDFNSFDGASEDSYNFDDTTIEDLEGLFSDPSLLEEFNAQLQ